MLCPLFKHICYICALDKAESLLNANITELAQTEKNNPLCIVYKDTSKLRLPEYPSPNSAPAISFPPQLLRLHQLRPFHQDHRCYGNSCLLLDSVVVLGALQRLRHFQSAWLLGLLLGCCCSAAFPLCFPDSCCSPPVL